MNTKRNRATRSRSDALIQLRRAASPRPCDTLRELLHAIENLKTTKRSILEKTFQTAGGHLMYLNFQKKAGKHMGTCQITSFSQDHLDAIIALQHSLMPAKKHWGIEEVRSSLMDAAHGYGKNVLLVWDQEARRLLGVGAWIIGGNGESFGAPLLAANETAASRLIEAIETEATSAKARWLRVITLLSEVPKARSLEARRFRRTFDFVEFEINPLAIAFQNGPLFPEGFARVNTADLDFSKYIETGNLAFHGVDNALPLTETEAKEIWQNECDTELSAVLCNTAGQYVGFTVVTAKGYIDSVGVHPDFQGRGIARALYISVMKTAAQRKMNRLYTVVSSNNVASLRLHEAMGFHESERRQVWELPLSEESHGHM